MSVSTTQMLKGISRLSSNGEKSSTSAPVSATIIAVNGGIRMRRTRTATQNPEIVPSSDFRFHNFVLPNFIPAIVATPSSTAEGNDCRYYNRQIKEDQAYQCADHEKSAPLPGSSSFLSRVSTISDIKGI